MIAHVRGVALALPAMVTFLLLTTPLTAAGPGHETHVRHASQSGVLHVDLLQKTTDELRLMRNEIFARHGRRFEASDLREYFSRQPWYKPRSDFNDLLLSRDEARLVDRIASREDEALAKTFSSQIAFCQQSGTMDVDLDGDGRLEHISAVPTDPTTVKLSVGTNTITEGGPGCIVALADIDAQDAYKEIIVGDEGPSDDDFSRFYRFDHGTLYKIGTVGGIPRTCTLVVDGSGIVKAQERGRILHTWFYKREYRVGNNQQLQPIPQKYLSMNSRVVILKDLPLVKSPDNGTPAGTLKKGEDAIIRRTDDVDWIEVLGKSRSGWVNVRTQFDLIHSGPATYFDGLSFAD